jgi:hypothetical protein
MRENSLSESLDQIIADRIALQCLIAALSSIIALPARLLVVFHALAVFTRDPGLVAGHDWTKPGERPIFQRFIPYATIDRTLGTSGERLRAFFFSPFQLNYSRTNFSGFTFACKVSALCLAVPELTRSTGIQLNR